MDKDLPYYESSKSLSHAIAEVIKSRFSQSKVRNIDGTLFIYLFFNYEVDNIEQFEKREEPFYFGKHQSIDNEFSCETFYTTSSCAIISSVTVPNDIKSIAVLYSLMAVDKKQIFKEKEETKFVLTIPRFTFNDVVINETEKHAIFRALTIIKERETLFEKWQYKEVDPSTKSILCFHGAAGTGKTMCAHAVADFLGKKLLIARYSQIQSKYTGEGEKNIRKYFETAEKEDAVLFIDEADTFLSKRLSSSNANSKIYNSMSNELFQLIEDHNGCIIFASNLVTDFDPAIISRIIEPIEFKLPDYNTRKIIIRKHIPSAVPFLEPLSESDFDKLASITDGFSGRDIRKACLICFADKLYTEKILNNKSDEEIYLSIDDVLIGFESVIDAKKKLEEAVNNTNKKVGDFVKKEEAKLRILQISAHALWADGKIDIQERQLFEEISSQFELKLNIDDISTIPDIVTICKKIHSQSEKMQIFEAACKMLAYDNDYPKEEQLFMDKLLEALDFDASLRTNVDVYINQIIECNKILRTMVSGFQLSISDILDTLKKEYTEAAAYYQLSKMYLTGSKDYPLIKINKEKAQEYLKKSADLGFIKAKDELDC